MLLSSWQKKPSVKLCKRETMSLVSLVERAQPGVKVFPQLALLDTSSQNSEHPPISMDLNKK